MSAVKKLMAAVRTVPTPLVHTLAAVILATAWTVMDTPAMVYTNSSDFVLCCMDSSSHKTTDIDECQEGAHLCDQTCINTVGSYMCQCNDGYTLSVDGTTCVGKVPNRA